MKGFANELMLERVLIRDERLLKSWAKEYGEQATQSLLRHYVHDEQSGDYLRLSQLGKPAVLQAIKKPSVKEQLSKFGVWVEEHPNEKLKLVFHIGDLFESWVVFSLKRYGYNVMDKDPKTGEQWTVEFDGVKGHLDIIAENNDERAVVEVKTMNDRYFNSFVKSGGSCDERGYLTQMATYTEASGLPGYWVCLNKNTQEVAVITPDENALERARSRAKQIIPRFTQVEQFQDLKGKFKAPPGEVEVYRKSPTGRVKVPASMRYSPYRDLFYNISVEKNGYGKYTEYCGTFEDGEVITDYRDPEETVEELENGIAVVRTTEPDEVDE